MIDHGTIRKMGTRSISILEIDASNFCTSIIRILFQPECIISADIEAGNELKN